ncbi:hypothetical protein [Caudoviricetes sp.]|nr:hypothetical protein [Caudoviricetes sp.]UOF79154.1 hypothetical protein [Caudoviricetes sp.]
MPLSSTSVKVYSVSIQSLSSNTGTQYVGDVTVTSSNGMAISPTDVAELDGPVGAREPHQFDLTDIYVDSSTSGAKFRVSAWIRD